MALCAAFLATLGALAFGPAGLSGVCASSLATRASWATDLVDREPVRMRHPAASPAGLERGQLLVASPKLFDPNFSRTVVLLLEYGESGALGLVLNRRTEMKLARLLPEVEELGGTSHRVYVGGPVARDGILLPGRGAEAPAGARSVLPDVHASGSLGVLRALLAGGGEFRAFLGHAGWGPKQLDGEVGRGDWLLVPATAADVFTPEPGQLWGALMRRLGGEWTRRRTLPLRPAALAFLAAPRE